MKRKSFPLFIASGLLLSPLAMADVDALMQDCNGCHGDNGVSQWTDVPTIAGLAEFVHADALYIYRDEARPCAESEYRQGDTSRPATTMCAIAAELSDDGLTVTLTTEAQTLGEFKAGERDQPGTMQKKLDALSDDDIKALVHYYGSIQ